MSNIELGEWVDINSIVLNPKNTNEHPQDQIEDLAKSILYQGWRSTLTVASKIGGVKTNILACGEGRLLAAKHLNLKKVPVCFQEFKDQDQFDAHVTADNALAKRSFLNFAKVNDSIKNFSPSFDRDMLGIKGFTLDRYEKNPIICQNCGHEVKTKQVGSK